MECQLSIIIPAYNAEKYIDETLKSAVSQTLRDKEIIVVDDGSTDHTREIIYQYRNHPLVSVYENGVNRGANYTYNYGVLQAKGEYLTFLDADDIFLPKYCEEVLAEMKHQNADIGFANLFALNGYEKQGTTLYGTPRDPRFVGLYGGPDHSFPHGDMASLRKMVLTGVHISPRSIYRRSLFQKIGLEDSRLRITHDWLRHIKFMVHGATCIFIPKALGYYRFHGEGNSQKDGVANTIENTKIAEIVLTEYAHLLTEEERVIVIHSYKQQRIQLFNAMANSDLTNGQIIEFLLTRRFAL